MTGVTTGVTSAGMTGRVSAGRAVRPRATVGVGTTARTTVPVGTLRAEAGPRTTGGEATAVTAGMIVRTTVVVATPRVVTAVTIVRTTVVVATPRVVTAVTTAGMTGRVSAGRAVRPRATVGVGTTARTTVPVGT
ncbi:hypothetical protein ACH9D2_06245, partial [Kocuria sp. M4R2S49]|uniref:hypothetical protein n=1 Tax=Kocuria rhizosphaericola TaxID=3376284 RepID=UPI00379BA12B